MKKSKKIENINKQNLISKFCLNKFSKKLFSRCKKIVQVYRKKTQDYIMSPILKRRRKIPQEIIKLCDIIEHENFNKVYNF